MLDRKKMLGSKIKKLREEKKLSRGELCGGEEELTVRQLARIEAGESLPTLPKIEYIAEQLSVSVAALVDRKYVELPKRYLQLKKRLCNFFTYKDKERIARKEDLFNEIYENYYDDLPEEEQLTIDVQRTSTDVALTDNVAFGNGILGEYFSQVLKRKEYSVNDLLIIELYFLYIHYKDYNEKTFMRLFQNLCNQADYAVDIEQFQLLRTVMVAVGVFMENNNYDKIIDAVTIANGIMKINQDFSKKPAIDMYEGKYWLFSQRNIETAKQKYLDGAQCAKLFDDEMLSEKIMAEWNLDLQEFQRRE
ncbi:helix-turn-helix domain-containing protein [Enterococcus sp. BWR-S5]|uniref:helix-turn-helix domain-containing protein n=1 Tax=Enterococcus sp. BWR-S5 TaxID=2787714 RepID=UPI0019216DA4|nr:XRE family transcriptional regulator [Enterococcus sp. BWR-S5]MBL1225762.1 helix-turn-helix domain-containing protein [Enterococcus sp. BWR-S5]